ncbi:glycoside hydrolase family 18 protein [Cellvibrio japonicus]|nr:glycoside hydrolase family 18 protein [Cellvibrio japonicus]QEI17673.1 glycoside hydrolase family 18 protein [Cellvibrio japonicus]QEI21248.1 glycoside hydrolase family 18 protein [Cellvibrio japonicus]
MNPTQASFTSTTSVASTQANHDDHGHHHDHNHDHHHHGYKAHEVKIIAYYMGDGSDLERYDVSQLTHIIYSFLHLQGNKLAFDNEQDIRTFKQLVALKQQHPQLKVLLSLGGWGGCETCSAVFGSAENRQAFADSTLALLKQYSGDGLDLDWEYPTVPGYPGHAYGPQDKPNFTALIQALRATLGEHYELSFAAGGFDSYLEQAVDWEVIMPLLDSVNLMSYDMVNGGTPHTGHHTALFSTDQQKDSTDNAVRFLLRNRVPPQKIVIGAAFYARVWQAVEPTNNGLYQAGTHVDGVNFKDYETHFGREQGFSYFWDETAQAPYVYNAATKTFATFDDKRSVTQKMRYAKQHGLGGVMFWQLPGDKDKEGLLDILYREKTATSP